MGCFFFLQRLNSRGLHEARSYELPVGEMLRGGRIVIRGTRVEVLDSSARSPSAAVTAAAAAALSF